MNLWYVSCGNRVPSTLPINSSMFRAISKSLTRHEQTQVKLMLLTTRLVRLPPSYTYNCLFSPQGATRLAQIPQRENDPRILALRNSRDFSMGTFIGAKLNRYRSVNKVRFGVRGEKLHLVCDLGRKQI